MTGRTHPVVGLLGEGPRTALVVAAARGRGWQIVPAAEPAGDGTVEAVAWTTFLDADACDAVLVDDAGWNASRAEAVRTLVQAGRTLVLAQPLELSMLWAFELDMIARDSGARLVPCLPDRLHPCVAALKAAVEASAAGSPGPLGQLESIRLERTLVDRTRDTVLASLARDVDIVRVLVGDPAKVATLGAADPESAWPTLAVGLTGPGQVPVRWQVAGGGDPGLRITLHHTRGPVEVFAPDGPGPWTASPTLPQAAAFDRGGVILDQLQASPTGDRPAAEPPVPPAAWPDAARALEIAETVPRSLARGRAIDLHHEEFSELGTFRGTMASLGCGIVLLALVLVVAATLVAGISREIGWEFGTAAANAWPVIVLGALVAFLAIQLLPLLLGPQQPPSGGREPDSGR